MSSKKDMRRPDLVVPYQAPAVKSTQGDFTSTVSSTLPMAAMFTRNKYIGWASVAFAIQTWLGESEESRKSTAQPAIFGVGMGFMSLAVTYLQLFLPNPQIVSSGTEAPAASAAPAAAA